MRSSTNFISTCRPIDIPACCLAILVRFACRFAAHKHVGEEFSAIRMLAVSRGGMSFRPFAIGACLPSKSKACLFSTLLFSHALSATLEHVELHKLYFHMPPDRHTGMLFGDLVRFACRFAAPKHAESLIATARMQK